MKKSDLHSYAGTAEDTEYDSQPAIRFIPNRSGHSRHITKRLYAPPVRVTGWLRPEFYHDSDVHYDGIHIHVGHIGNERNYVASIVRRDGNQKIAVEYGWREYQSIDASPADGVSLKWDRTYMFEVIWEGKEITTWVGNEVEQAVMSATIPDDRWIPCGSVGVRLDNIEAVGNFHVTQ